ncbi:GIY-YIG nuclease family protein [Escherichia coli]|nr:GIY-YIG nuclease family protein [Escherichia coli]
MKLAFAKDIDFVKVGKQKTPQFYEEICIEYAHKTKKTFKGFILPWEANRTRTLFIDNESGKESTPMLINVRTSWGKVKGCKLDKGISPTVKHKAMNLSSEKKQQKLEKLYSDVRKAVEHGNNKLIRITGELPSRYKSYAECKCLTHNEIFVRNCRDLIHKGSAACPQCLSVMRSMQNGISHYKYHGKIRPVSLYIQSLDKEFIKFGISINPEARMREQQRNSPFIHSLVYTHEFKEGWKAVDVEYGIKTIFKGKKLTIDDLSTGYTETRDYKLLSEIIKFVDDYIKTDPTVPQYIQDENEFWSQIGGDFELEESTFVFPDTSDEEYYNNLAELDLSPLEAV